MLSDALKHLLSSFSEWKKSDEELVRETQHFLEMLEELKLHEMNSALPQMQQLVEEEIVELAKALKLSREELASQCHDPIHFSKNAAELVQKLEKKLSESYVKISRAERPEEKPPKKGEPHKGKVKHPRKEEWKKL